MALTIDPGLCPQKHASPLEKLSPARANTKYIHEGIQIPLST